MEMAFYYDSPSFDPLDETSRGAPLMQGHGDMGWVSQRDLAEYQGCNAMVGLSPENSEATCCASITKECEPS
jgi:hypothetical protein